MVINGASRVNFEVGVEASLLDDISEDTLRSWAPADVTQANEENGEGFGLHVSGGGRC